MKIKLKKRYKILIRLVVVRRDYSTYGLLKSCLEAIGCKVLIVSSNNFTLALKLWRPDAVIVHTLTSGKIANDILPSVKKFFLDVEGFRVQNLSHAKFFLEQKNYMKYFSYFFFWGQRIIGEFQKFAPNLDRSKIKIIGNPKLDLARYLKKNLKKKTQKSMTIGIATRFHALNNHRARPLIFSIANNPDKYKYTDTQIKSFLALMDVMKAIIKETKFKISIRVHPFEAIQGYEDNLKRWFGQKNLHRFHIDESLDFSEWVINQDVVITPTSTALSECYLLNKPVINIDKIAKVVEYNKSRDKVVDDWFNGAYLPPTVTELIKMLKKKKLAVKKCKAVDEMLKNYCDWHNGRFAAKVSMDYIIKELNESIVPKFKISFPYEIVKSIISIKDRIMNFKNPLLKNFNYSTFYHKSPLIYSKVKKQILNN